jgi:hypothetical protein
VGKSQQPEEASQQLGQLVSKEECLPLPVPPMRMNTEEDCNMLEWQPLGTNQETGARQPVPEGGIEETGPKQEEIVTSRLPWRMKLMSTCLKVTARNPTVRAIMDLVPYE